jgi:predicted Rossmann fold nucleotide-binding protein DprA/Smf involved in DNA uptake
MQARNRRLVDESAACICCMTDEKSGTGYTVRYAQKSGLAVYNVAK